MHEWEKNEKYSSRLLQSERVARKRSLPEEGRQSYGVRDTRFGARFGTSSITLGKLKTVEKPRFFKTGLALRKWLAQNHEKADELWIGFYKKSSGKGGLTYREALDQALAFGWIDGVRKTFDETNYMIRFTPRRPKSIWSTVNVKRVGELTKLGLMEPAGLRAFEARDVTRQGYSYEQHSAALDPGHEKKFRRNKKAWKFFEDQPPYYRKTMTFWVMSAKREETRLKRLERLIQESENERRIF